MCSPASRRASAAAVEVYGREVTTGLTRAARENDGAGEVGYECRGGPRRELARRSLLDDPAVAQDADPVTEQGAAITNMEPGKRGTRAYFTVDDINAGAARVNELGGKADQPMPVPSMGWFATCTDPHGNEFGLWQTDESAPAPTA